MSQDTVVDRNPVTGEVLREFEAASKKEIDLAVQQSRHAFPAWKERSLQERVNCLGRLRAVILANLQEIADRIVESTGKAELEPLWTDILPTLEQMRYYERNAERILASEKRKNPLIFFKNRSWVEYHPFGVVLVIAPWNLPLQLTLIPAITALTAGNTVIMKPSEKTPGIGQLAAELFKEAGYPPEVVQVLQGGAKTGAGCIAAKPDFIFCTGSVETGKKVMTGAARHLIPVKLELGGKDPLIVFSDADLKRAAAGAVYGSLVNSGQICAGIERMYVQDTVYDEFVNYLQKEVQKVRVGRGCEVEMGSLIDYDQLRKIKSILKEALAGGARPLHELYEEGLFLGPLFLRDTQPDMDIMEKEVFGPVVPIAPFSCEEDAVELANSSQFGLNASLWTEDRKRGARVASKLETGNCYINEVVKNIGHPNLPFGGVKMSGFGRYHGPEGLYACTYQKSIVESRSRRPREPNWFPYSRQMHSDLMRFLKKYYGDTPLYRRLWELLRLSRSRKE